MKKELFEFFSNLCETHNAISDENSLALNIDVEGTFGLNSLQSIKYLAINKQNDTIWLLIGTDEHDADWEDMSRLSETELRYLKRQVVLNDEAEAYVKAQVEKNGGNTVYQQTLMLEAYKAGANARMLIGKKI